MRKVEHHKKPQKNKLFLLISKAYAYFYPMAKRWVHHFHGGVFPQYNKELSNSHPLKETYLPKELVLPLQQHVGIATQPLVSIGEMVQKNQCIADTDKGLSAPIHAPTSGKIIAIEPRVTAHASGLSSQCIILQPDGLDTALENALKVDFKKPNTPESLKEIIHKAGIVGMGGAGFPTFAKLPKEKGQIHTLLINGAECEPFITCDDLLMQHHAEEIIQGAMIVAEALGATKVLCGIENNKPHAIKRMTKAAQNTLVKIHSVPTVYPMGGQKQLTQELTGIEVPAKSHSVDIGMLMMNIATYRAIFHAVTQGNPLTERYVTVSGLGLESPYNINALIGTPFEELAALAKPKVPLTYPLIMGGPMMGIQVPNNQVPVVKTSNCVLANPPQPVDDALPCIRCGECMDACPMNLLPQQMYWHSRSEEFDKVEKLKVFDCIECGCCSFVCPSKIPLVQYYRHSKSAIKTIRAEEQAAELAKQRHEAKLARIAREKAEKEARMKAKKAAVKKKAAAKTDTSSAPETKKKPAAAAAAARAAAAKKAAAAKAKANTNSTEQANPAETKPISAREKAIAAAKARAAAKSTTNQAAQVPTEEKSAQPLSAREKAIAAAKKRAATKKAESSLQATETATEPSKEEKRQAAVEAARQRAAAKKTKAQTAEAESQPAELSKEDKRKAAVEAARKRAEAKKAQQQESAEENESSAEMSKEDKRKAAVEAARKRAAEKKAQAETTEQIQTAETPTELSKEDKRKAAVEAARQRAAAKKAQQKTTVIEEENEPAELSKEDKREAAVEAARKRAAARKAKQQEES